MAHDNSRFCVSFSIKMSSGAFPNPDLKVPEKLKKLSSFFKDNIFIITRVNPGAVSARVLAKMSIQKSGVSGASTITMQVARLFNPKSRNYGHKILEILQAFRKWKYAIRRKFS
ncbi:MAG: transglycosylase domain-containing protein [Calditrichia bacterium]